MTWGPGSELCRKPSCNQLNIIFSFLMMKMEYCVYCLPPRRILNVCERDWENIKLYKCKGFIQKADTVCFFSGGRSGSSDSALEVRCSFLSGMG